MDILDTSPAFADLLKTTRCKHVPKGQIILYQGDMANDVFVLKKGIVKIYDIDENGNEKILHVVRPPAVLPLVFFSGTNEPTHWFYATHTDCDIYTIPVATLRERMSHDAKLTEFITSWFSREVHELLVRLSSLSKTVTRDKVIAALKFLAVHHAAERRGGWFRVGFPVSHQMIADMVGVTRESVAMVMKELQDEGLVRNPRLTILEIHFKKLIA